MSMVQSQVLALAYGSLMALAYVGLYVLGEDSWMAYLLFVPGLLILKAMNTPQAGSAGDDVGRTSFLAELAAVGARRLTRIGLALVAVCILAGVLIEAIGLNDLTMALVFIPALLLVSLVDRDFFGWTDGDDRSSSASTS